MTANLTGSEDYFGETEISTVSQSDINHGVDPLAPSRVQLREALDECLDSDNDIWSFSQWNERLGPPLCRAYRIYCLLLELGESGVSDFKQHPAFASRKRGPWKQRPALLAVQLALKPRDEKESKRTSELANVLVALRQQCVPIDGFGDALRETTLSECISDVRRRKRELKALESAPTNSPAIGPSDPRDEDGTVSAAFSRETCVKNYATDTGSDQTEASILEIRAWRETQAHSHWLILRSGELDRIIAAIAEWRCWHPDRISEVLAATQTSEREPEQSA